MFCGIQTNGVNTMNEAYLCDCMEYMSTIRDNEFNLAVCDPPYGIKYGRGHNGWGCVDHRPSLKDLDWDVAPHKAVFDEIRRVSKNQIIWGGQYFTDKLPQSNCWIVWDKICDTPNKSVFSDCELAWTSFSEVSRMFKLRQMGFIVDTQEKDRIHPTQKPIELYRWLIQNYAEPGQAIFDPFLGSGTSRRAAYDLKMDFVGCECNKDSFDKQEDAFERYTRQGRLDELL